MTDSIEERLRSASFSKRGNGVFASHADPRVVAIVEARSDPGEWSHRVSSMLRNESFNMAPTWCRYIVVALDVDKTPELALAAAAFARDVSKCRRLVAFRNQDSAEMIPFLPLPSVPGGVGTASHDFEAIVHSAIRSVDIASAFLDDQIPTSRVQSMAEKTPEA